MKKIVGILLLSIIGFLNGNLIVFGCQEIDFDTYGSICVDLIKDNNTYQISVDYNNLNSLIYSNAYYYILLPNNAGGLLSPKLTNYGNFTYNHRSYNYDNDIRKIKLYAIIGNEVRSKEAYYDFANGDRKNNPNQFSNENANKNLTNFIITTNNSIQPINKRIDLNIKVVDNKNRKITDYTNTIKFKIYYRESNSTSWIETTSFNVYEIHPDYENGYKFSSSEKGETILSDFIKFKKNYDYKIRVYEKNNSSIYNEIIIKTKKDYSSVNSEIDNFYITSSNSMPDINERIDITIKARDNNNYTVTDYEDDVEFTVYYKTFGSNTRIKTTSSNHYVLGANYSNGYFFKRSDKGVAKLNNFIKFKQNYDYKIVINDANDPSINGYIIFNLNTKTSEIDGFTTKELETVKKIYNSRNRMINNLKNSYPKLKNNNTWIEMSNTFYKNMKEVIENVNNKEFSNYSDFLKGFKNWYNYTISSR